MGEPLMENESHAEMIAGGIGIFLIILGMLLTI
jgi:hypothetical protein